MNKVWKRTLCLILSLILVVGLLTSVGAEDTNIRQFRSYCSIGDSVAYCIQHTDEEGSFPRIVGRAVGCTDEKLHIQYPGMRVKDLLVALGVDPIDEDDLFYDGAPFDTRWYKEYDSDEYEEKIRQAELITLELGMNDVLYYAFYLLDVETLISESSSLSEKTEAVKAGLAALNEGYASFCKNYTRLLDRIRELKSGQDYTVVLVSTYNSSNFLMLTDELLIPICQALTLYTSQMNKLIEQAAKDYGFLYADISNVEIGAMAYQMTIADMTSDDQGTLSSHPTYPDGYAYIARQILNQLQKEKPAPDTNIRVDLGSVSNISTVLVGSKAVRSSKYNLNPDTHLLTVQYGSKLANLLTVIDEEDGKISAYVYQLHYREEEGYRAYMIFQTRDITRVFTATTGLIRKGFSSIGSALGK